MVTPCAGEDFLPGNITAEGAAAMLSVFISLGQSFAFQ